MNATIETLNSVQRRIKISVPSDKVNAAFDDAYRNIGRNAQIQGFRKGKAPLSVLRKVYGERVTGQVIDNLINGTLFSAMEENAVNPIASPMIEAEVAPQPNQPFEFSAVVDVMPEIALEGYKNLAVSVPVITVDEDMVESEIKGLRRRHANLQNAEPSQTAEKGYMAILTQHAYEGERELEQFHVSDLEVDLGENQLFADLEAGIFGMKVDENKRIDVTLPENFQDSELAGKSLHFDVKLQSLKKIVLPELDEEFAKDVECESLDDLQKQIREALEQRAAQLRRQETEKQLLDQIMAKNNFEVPPSLVDQIIDSMIREMRWPSEEECEKNLKNDDLRKEIRPNARQRTRNALALWQVFRQEELKVEDSEVDERLAATFGSTPTNLDTQTQTRIKEKIRENLTFEKALDFLTESATITEIPTKP